MATNFIWNSGEYPLQPGVYLMKDATGKIIYVGKAKKLRTRLASYFRSTGGHTPKTRALVERIASIDILLTSNEKEALLLEASLIKKHKPRYNVVLRDDKQYVLFRLDKKSEYPRLTVTRKVVRDGSVYFGPFTSGTAAKATWKLLGKVFPLRKCNDNAFRNRVRPCLYHHIKQCLAPCVLDVEPAVYKEIVRKVEMFLSGRTGELLERLRREMQLASESLEFERAAEYRDQIRAVQKTVERQVVVMQDDKDQDVIGLAEVSGGLGLGLLYIRQGRLLDEKQFFWPGLTLEEGPEVLESFISQFYGVERFIPSRIIVPAALDTEALGEALAERREGKVRIAAASNAHENHLVDIARKVARRVREEKENLTQRLQRLLRLDLEPVRIECIDASHLGGEGMRVGMVVFEHGQRIKEDTRIYTFPELEGTGDDYAALAAWVSRRLESGPPWPDLLLIDGGRGNFPQWSVSWRMRVRMWAGSWRPLPRGRPDAPGRWRTGFFALAARTPCPSSRAVRNCCFCSGCATKPTALSSVGSGVHARNACWTVNC